VRPALGEELDVVPTDEFGKPDASLLHALTPSWRKNLSGDQGLVGDALRGGGRGHSPGAGVRNGRDGQFVRVSYPPCSRLLVLR
jgi:hypothetical protein